MAGWEPSGVFWLVLAQAQPAGKSLLAEGLIQIRLDHDIAQELQGAGPPGTAQGELPGVGLLGPGDLKRPAGRPGPDPRPGRHRAAPGRPAPPHPAAPAPDRPPPECRRPGPPAAPGRRCRCGWERRTRRWRHRPRTRASPVSAPRKRAAGYFCASAARAGPSPTTSLVPGRSSARKASIFFSTATRPT